MTIFDHPRFDVEQVSATRCLAQYFGAFAHASLTIMARSGAPLKLTFANQVGLNDGVQLFSKHRKLAPESVVVCKATQNELRQIEPVRVRSKSDLAGQDCAWNIQVSADKADRLVLNLLPGIDVDAVSAAIRKDWLTLRHMALSEATQSRPITLKDTPGDGWGVLDHIPVATLLLDAKGTLHRCNRAGARVLKKETVLRRGKGGIYAAHDSESAVFRDALRACSTAVMGRDMTVFLTLTDSGHQAPVTLSRYSHKGELTSYVLVTLPVPPSPRRIEDLARKLGLNPSEARVAALLQMGHSNREAAEISGLKPQTFNTYAKRVFGKLNVKCRTEMAQMLTWQALGRGPS